MGVVLALALAGGAAEGCTCAGRPEDAWVGDHDPSMDEIAGALAPILWFTREEPAFADGDGTAPAVHPCDPAPAHGPVVYYQVQSVHLRGDTEVTLPPESGPALFEKAADAVVRFFFYYRVDYGFGQHPHDTEGMDFHVVFERRGECRAIRLESVEGLAHGISWYWNLLVAEPDLRQPVTVLVEEGKHASCPDRNGDGIYTPGYDVNRRVNDAWGVRDVFGSGYLFGGQYRSSMTKPRRAELRVLPPETDRRCLPERNRADPAEDGYRARYELRSSRPIDLCDAPDAAELHAMMRTNGFGRDAPLRQYEFAVVPRLTAPLAGTGGILSNVALRYDRELGIAVLLRGIDLRELWLVPRLTYSFGRSFSGEALFTGSASQYSSTYLSVGVAREHPRFVLADGDSRSLPGFEWKLAEEVGMKFRFPVAGWQRLAALGYHFGGLRLGVRNSGYPSIHNLRFIVELGGGVW